MKKLHMFSSVTKYILSEPFSNDIYEHYSVPYVCLFAGLSSNTNAIDFLTEYPRHIDWFLLSANPCAIPILIENKDHIEWNQLSANTTDDDRLLELFVSVPPEWLSWISLSSNCSKHAVTMLYLYQDKIEYSSLAKNTNPDVLPLLSMYIADTISTKETFPLGFWMWLSRNPIASSILMKYKEYISWKDLSYNSSDIAIDLLLSEPEKIKWPMFSLNTNPRAIAFLSQHPNYIRWDLLSANVADEAVALLRNNKRKIDWMWFSENENPIAVEMLDEPENFDSIYWPALCSNKAAIKIIKKNYCTNYSLIDFHSLAFNTAIFEIVE